MKMECELSQKNTKHVFIILGLALMNISLF